MSSSEAKLVFSDCLFLIKAGSLEGRDGDSFPHPSLSFWTKTIYKIPSRPDMSIILRQDFWTFVCPTGSYFGSHQVVREGITSKTTDVPWKNVQSLFNTNTTACIANPLSLILYHLSSHLFRVIYLNNVLTFQKGAIRDELLSSFLQFLFVIILNWKKKKETKFNDPVALAWDSELSGSCSSRTFRFQTRWSILISGLQRLTHLMINWD